MFVRCAGTFRVHETDSSERTPYPEPKNSTVTSIYQKPASFVPLPWWKDEPDKTVLFIPRRLTARTGIYEFLMRFLSLPADEQQKYHIYISGTGELAPKIETIAKEYPQTITYLGFVPYEELWAIYGKADAVVVPTLSLEGFGYVILEAMACGCAATVSTTCGGGYEFVSEQLGEEYTFDSFDTESILKPCDSSRHALRIGLFTNKSHPVFLRNT